MVGAPFEGSWDTVAGAAYYTGAGSGEVIWVVISAVICLVAIISGGIHEASSYRKLE